MYKSSILLFIVFSSFLVPNFFKEESYERQNENKKTFDVQPLNKANELTNGDVTNLIPHIGYSFFIGDSTNDSIEYTRIDKSSGTLYLIGETNSPDLPIKNAFQETWGGNNNISEQNPIPDSYGDAFVMAFAKNGSLLYSTYIGGSGSDIITHVEIDETTGFLFLCGITESPDFPIKNEFQTSFSGSSDKFLMTIASNGSLLFSSYLGMGGSLIDINQMSLNKKFEIIYLTGNTNSHFFQTVNAFQGSYKGSSEGFVTAISYNGSVLFSSYLGGTNAESIDKVFVDESEGTIYLGGSTSSFDFPTKNAFQTFSGSTNGFFTAILPNGSIKFSSYISTQVDSLIFNEESETFYLSGTTNLEGLQTFNAFQDLLGGSIDGFLSAITTNGILLFSTYLGGSDNDFISFLGFDSQSEILYVSGITTSNNFPTKNAFQNTYSQNNDGFIMGMAKSGFLLFSSYLGGNGDDYISVMSIDEFSHSVVLGGSTDSNDFPVTNEFQQNIEKNGNNLNSNNSTDGFLSKIANNGTLIFSTLIGGSDNDAIQFIEVNGNNGVAYIGGSTDSSDFPLKNEFQDPTPADHKDCFYYCTNIYIFLLAISENESLLFCSFLGGTSSESLDFFEADFQFGFIYLSGTTDSSDFPIKNAYENYFTQFSNHYMTKIIVEPDNNNNGIGDKWENEYGLDNSSPFADPDGDNLNNLEEYYLGTNPLLFDTDSDGLDDGYEVTYGFNPTVYDDHGHLDTDGDLVSNLAEYRARTDPLNIFSFPILSFNLIYLIIIIISIFLIVLLKILIFLFKILRFKNKFQIPSLGLAIKVWVSDFPDPKTYQDALKKNATSISDYKRVLKTKAPNLHIANEIIAGNFKDYEQYLQAKVVDASTLEQFQLVEKLNAPDYNTALKIETGGFPSFDIYTIAVNKGFLTYDDYIKSKTNTKE